MVRNGIAAFAGMTMIATAWASSVSVSTPPVTPIELGDHPNTAFDAGEKFIFNIRYEFISAGTATMEVSSGPITNGRPTFHLESRAASNSFVDKFFQVRDFNASTMDQCSLYSLNFHQNLKEGKYKVIRNTSFHYAKRTYTFHRVRRGTTTERSGPIEKPLHDMLSSFFYARTLDLKPKTEVAITVFSDEEVYDLKVTVGPKVQKITVPAGTFECLVLHPVILGDGIFKAKDGKMEIWVTNDWRKMPVLIRSKVFIGSVDAELQDVKFGDNPVLTP